MKCPLSPQSHYPELNTTKCRWGECLKEECAWWDEDKNCCSIKVIVGDKENKNRG